LNFPEVRDVGQSRPVAVVLVSATHEMPNPKQGCGQTSRERIGSPFGSRSGNSQKKQVDGNSNRMDFATNKVGFVPRDIVNCFVPGIGTSLANIEEPGNCEFVSWARLANNK
jgi:hypothetical protein